MSTAQQSGYYFETAGDGRELIVPHRLQGLVHYSRGSDKTWSWPEYFAENYVISDASAVQSGFDRGNLEVVANRGGQLVHFWRSSLDGAWRQTVVIPHSDGVTGNPALIQSSFPYPANPDYRGNFEVIVPLASGGLAHFWRDNQTAGFPWHGPTAVFGAGRGRYDAVALIQSTFGPGNFEAVARQGDRLFHFYRDARILQWSAGTQIDGGGGITGVPSLVQTTYGTFQVICPRAGGGIVTFSRDNNAPNYPWTRSREPFGTGSITAVSLIQASSGYFELIARESDHLAFYWQNARGDGDGPLYVAGFDSGSYPIGSGVIQKSQEFQDNKFGLFIHWGIYSVAGKGELFQFDRKLSGFVYRQQCANNFNPSAFDAANWVQQVRQTGMNYIVFTAKHADGLAMWRTATTNWNVVKATPWNKDPLKLLAGECHKADMKLFVYYNLIDFHNPDYYCTSGIKYFFSPDSSSCASETSPSFNNYVGYVRRQLAELLTRYGPIAGVWIDGAYDRDDWTAPGVNGRTPLDILYSQIAQAQPQAEARLVCNLGHTPYAGESYSNLEQGYYKDAPKFYEDDYARYGGPTYGEQWPEWKFRPTSLPVETCATILYNPSSYNSPADQTNYKPVPWGYVDDGEVLAEGLRLKSGEDLIRQLVKAAGANSNYLLNAGPKPDGTIQADFLSRLGRIGKWLNPGFGGPNNGVGYAGSIYNTRGGPLSPTKDFVTTQSVDGRVVYLHLLTNLPSGGSIPSVTPVTISVPAIPGVTRVRTFFSHTVVHHQIQGGRLVIDYEIVVKGEEPPSPPDEWDTVATFVLDREIP